MQVKNTSGMAKTINISSFAYRTKVVTQENIELKPVPGYLICRSQQPQVEEFEVLLPGRTYYYNLGIEIKQESIYVCGIKYIIKTGEVYRVYLVIEPFFLLLNKSNLSEISNKLGLINYVDQPIDCGEASLILK